MNCEVFVQLDTCVHLCTLERCERQQRYPERRGREAPYGWPQYVVVCVSIKYVVNFGQLDTSRLLVSAVASVNSGIQHLEAEQHHMDDCRIKHSL